MQTFQGDGDENVHSLDYFYTESWHGKQSLIENSIHILNIVYIY